MRSEDKAQYLCSILVLLGALKLLVLIFHCNLLNIYSNKSDVTWALDGIWCSSDIKNTKILLQESVSI